MPAGLVNQLMGCYWLESGVEIESPEHSRETSEDILTAIKRVRSRPKPQFDF